MTVLIIASNLDRSVDRVVVALGERDVPVFRMDCAEFPQKIRLSADLSGGRWSGHLATVARRVELEDVRSVWYRSPTQFLFAEGMSDAERLHAEREARIGLGGVVVSLPGQVNHPHRVAAATKPVQLIAASKSGMNVLSTRITNCGGSAREFASNEPDQVVTKLFVNGITENCRPMVGHTHLVTVEDLADTRGIETTAHQFQRFVRKRYDLRVVAIGSVMFAVAIYPLSPAARIDFRSDYRSLRHESVELSAELKVCVRKLMSQLGLAFGCLDFVVDHDGVAHFLEVNPTGQYGWLESEAGIPVTSTLATLLSATNTPQVDSENV